MKAQSSSIPGFASGWTPESCKKEARCVLLLPAQADHFELSVDSICELWNQQSFRTAYLDVKAPFLENISILENLWLVLANRRSVALEQIIQNADHLRPLFRWSENDLQHLLSSRPGDLSATLQGCAVLLRSMLMEPDWLVINHSWFQRPLLPRSQVLSLLQHALGGSRWLLLWPDDQSPLPPEVSWNRIPLEAGEKR